MEINIIDFEKDYEESALKLFYQSVFNNRKEFEYARIPSWSHRYTIEKNSIRLLAISNGEIIGSLGLLSYHGYVKGKKKKIGFFVDNCILPKYDSKYNQIMFSLFQEIEKKAKKKGFTHILGWDYKEKADTHSSLYKKLGYSKVSGINWFGGGTRPIHIFYENNFHLSILWKIALNLYNLKYRIHESKLSPLNDVKIRKIKDKDLPAAVDLINFQNEHLEFSPRYTTDLLKKTMQKYCAEGLIAEVNKKIAGVIIFFVAPWSGWMYGKPQYTKSHAFILIKHPLEFAVHPDYVEKIAPHLLFRVMAGKNEKKYQMFVDVFDRRVEWMRKAYNEIGADELPYDFGVLLVKNLSNDKIELRKPVYIPTNLVISPYTAKGISNK